MRVVPFADAHGHVDGGLFVARRCHETTQLEGEFASRAADVGAVSEATRALARSVDPAAARTAFCTARARSPRRPWRRCSSPATVLTIAGGPGVGRRRTRRSRGGDRRRVRRGAGVQPRGGGFRARSGAQQKPTRSSCAAPEPRRCSGIRCVRDRAAIGVLAVAWRDETAGVSLRLSAMLDLLAAEAAVAIGRADLLGQLEHMARTDSLTGLPNRRYWEQQLPARARARETRRESAVRGDARPRSLQGLQRPPRPPGRRSAADRGRRQPGGWRCVPTTSSLATAARSSASSCPAARSTTRSA